MIKQSEYIKSFVDIKDVDDNELPQILLLGRSNVGKSSLINALTNRKNLARVSSTPGKTVTLNLYLLNESFYLVDAPGYGYARRSRTQQQSFMQMIVDFVAKSKKLKRIFLLVDFKVGPTEDDLTLYQELVKLSVEAVIISTKYDKIPKTKRFKQEQKIKQALMPGQKIFFVSSQTKTGIDALTKEVISIVDSSNI